MSKYEYMLEQTEVIKKKVMEAGSTKEAVEILLNACNIFKGRILKSVSKEVAEAYAQVAALKHYQEEEQYFNDKWEEKTMHAFKKADAYNIKAKAIRQIIPAFKILDGKLLNVKIENVLKQFDTDFLKYSYVKYGLRIEIRAEYPKNKESFCVLGIYKPKSDFLDDKKKLQAEPIINHLISIAKEYDQTAQEARKIALSLHEDIRTINRHIQEIKKIQKKLQNNHIINEITYDFFRRMYY